MLETVRRLAESCLERHHPPGAAFNVPVYLVAALPGTLYTAVRSEMREENLGTYMYPPHGGARWWHAQHIQYGARSSALPSEL